MSTSLALNAPESSWTITRILLNIGFKWVEHFLEPAGKFSGIFFNITIILR